MADAAVDGQKDPRPEMAYQLALDQLARQVAALDELRARVGVVLSGAAVATGFLAGQALNTSTGIPSPAWLGISAGLALIVCSAVVLWPRELQGLTYNPKSVLHDIEIAPHRPIAEYYTAVAGYAVGHLEANERMLRRLYLTFATSLGLLVLDFVGWVWTLATNNGGLG